MSSFGLRRRPFNLMLQNGVRIKLEKLWLGLKTQGYEVDRADIIELLLVDSSVEKLEQLIKQRA